MLEILKKDTFIKDILLMLLLSIVGSALFATGFAMVTDKYFAKAITGVIGDFGQYDLLFQTREELKGAMVRQIRQVIAERFPGATLRAGMSVVGKASFFLTLPERYKNKAVFNSLGYYFNNLPGNGSFTIMTEPRLNIASVPGGIFDRLSKEVEQLPEVRFTYNDGGSIGVILKNARAVKPVQRKIEALLSKYQILEVRWTQVTNPEELMAMGKKVSQALLDIKGVGYAKDITMSSGSDDYQYLVNTLFEVKRFLTAYAAEVKLNLNPGRNLEVGDLVAVNGQNVKKLKPGELLEPLDVVIKVTSKDSAGVHGMIIQGDSSFLRDNVAYKLLPEDKIGGAVGTIEVSSRKAQLIYAMDQGIKLLTQLNMAIADFNRTTGGAGMTVSGIEKVYRRLADVSAAMRAVESNINALGGKVSRENLTRMVVLINSVGDDLDYLAKTFGRVQLLENRFNQALDGLHGAQYLFGSPLVQNSLGSSGIGAKLQLLDTQLTAVEESLRSRVRKLDDFINRFNPLVSVLLNWRNKAREFATQVNNFGAVFTPGSANYKQLTGLLRSTEAIITNITGFNLPELKNGLDIISNRFFGSDKIDLTALIAELERVKDSLPRLMDEEIGRSVGLIDKYAGGDSRPGQSIQIFTRAHLDRELVDAAIRDNLHMPDVSIFSLPVGTIQPDIRGELYKILGEVRSTIAALVVIILWVLTFILDQSLVISMLKMMGFSLVPKKLKFSSPVWTWLYSLFVKVINPATLYAFLIGGVWLGFTFALAGAEIPYLNYWVIGLIGSLLGILIATAAERINPVNRDEIMAGLSLGLPFRTIMREIVIPAGRPGLLQLLNRRKMVMK